MSIDDNNSRRPRRTKAQLREDMIALRRDTILELHMKGESETSISRILQVSQSTVSNDMKNIREQAKEKIHNIIQEELPLAWSKARKALQHIAKEALDIANDPKTNTPQRLQALALLKETQTEEFELVANSTVLNDAMQFVASHSQTLDNIQKALEERQKREPAAEDEEPKGDELIDEEEIENEFSEGFSEYTESN